MDIKNLADIASALAYAADSASDEVAIAYSVGDVIELSVHDEATGELRNVSVRLSFA